VNDTFYQALDFRGSPVLTELVSTGSVDSPELRLTLHSHKPLAAETVNTIQQLVFSMFSVSDDMSPFYRAIARDTFMAGLILRLRGLRVPATPTVFEALVDSVIEQQISLTAARRVENRLIRAAGNSAVFDGNTWYCYPTPGILARTTDSTFRACGLTLRKGEYIRGISRDILTGNLDLEHFRNYPDTDSIMSELVKIRGVGTWTAELTILRGLHRADAFPADDVGVRRFISRYYRNGEKISAAEARVFAERWGPWKGFVAYYLEVADLLGIQPGT
jgi:DNA-3-methyladenine glycosylase II